MATKQELEQQVAKMTEEAKRSAEKLQQVLSESRRFQQDADREARNYRDCEHRLNAIRLIVESTLEVKYTTGTESPQEYFRGKMLADDSPEEVRLLRHIYKLSNVQPPF